MTEDFVIKYFWSAIGYGLMSIPIFFPAIGNSVIPSHTANASGEHDHIAARAEGKHLPSLR
jgi:ATP-binding cassette subfamily D (ALD) long-chain fatty acid import protein